MVVAAMMDLLDLAVADEIVTDIPKRGLPRELSVDGLPIPFAVSHEGGEVRWAKVDTKLTMLCTLDQLCHVCGEHLADEDAGGFVDMMGRVIDGWMMHQRCAKLAQAHCPFLNRDVGVSTFVASPVEGLAPRLRQDAYRKLAQRG